MQFLITEEEAMAVIEKNMDKIEARMASGTSANQSLANANNGDGGGSSPCNGSCDDTTCCNCCIC